MHHASHSVTNLRMEEEDSDDAIEQLKEYSTSLAFTVRHTTPVLRAIQRVGESDNVAPANGDLCHCCKTTDWHASDSVEHDRSPHEGYAVLSTTSVANSDKHMLADTPAPTACHGCSPVRATASSLASIRDSDLPVGLYKNNVKPTPIDRNFFKSMAKTIKANRAPIPDPEFADEQTCTHYTGYYTSNSCGGKTRYVNWIVGEAMRVRIELKFCLLHERMLRLRTIGVFGDESEYVVGSS